MNKEILKPADVAKMLGVSRKTIDRMMKRGEVKHFTLPNGYRKIYKEDVQKIIDGK